MDFVEFVVKYWKYISIGLVILFNLLLFILKKKPIEVVNSIKQVLYERIPEWIKTAEFSLQTGKEKKDLVLKMVKDFLEFHGIQFSKYYEDFASKYIEEVLSTPQKKGK